jgi:beta-lactamase regulating signal transducer with metallopeptidase domain
MNQANLLLSSMAQAIGHTIVLSLAQAFIIFICLRIILKLIPHSASNIKYNLSYCAYMAMGVWFIVTLGHQYFVAHEQLNFVYTAGIPSHDDILNATASQDLSVLFSISFLNEYLPLIAAFYILGIGWYTLRFLLNFIKINQLKSTEIIELDFHWQQKLRRLASYMDVKVPLQAFFSTRVNTPMMIGFIKPVILLPFSAMSKLSNEQFEAILLHELAHIRRNDYLLNIIQSAFDIILFFNPFAWWVTKYIREEREKSCDEMVVQYSTPFHYARALLSLEEPLKKQALVMTAVSKRSYLLHRIKNIMEMKNNQLGLRQKLITLLIISIATISVAWLNPSTSPAFQKNMSKIEPKDKMKATTPLFFNSMNFWPAADSLPENVAPVPPKVPAPPVAALQGKMPPPPPSPPLVPPTPPSVPVPPMPGMAPLPPAPLPPSLKNDSLPPMMNYFDSKAWKQQQEAIKKNAEQMHKFFESDAWKKQQQAIKKSTEQMQKYFESDAWKKQQDLLRENAVAMQKYFDSPEWKKQQELIRENADNLKKYFNSPQWKKQQELLKMNSEKIKKYFDSPEWKKQQELLKKNAEKTQKYFNSPEWKEQQKQWQHFNDSLFSNPQNKPAQNSLQNLQHSIEKIQQNLSIRLG